MKQPRRLTRLESRHATQARLIEAAEKTFIRFGFDASSVERIADAAGFSRGAFYSNFRDKDELFVAVLNKRSLAVSSALGEIFRREPNAGKRLRAVRDWYVSQEQQKQWMILETEFTLRAIRNPALKVRLAGLRRQELETYSEMVAQHFAQTGRPAIDRPASIALSLMAIAQGLGRLSLVHTDRDAREQFAEARNLVFNRPIATPGGAPAQIEETQE